jgi:hypothetical protein
VLHPGIVDEDVDRADIGHHLRDRACVHQVGAVVARTQFLAQHSNRRRIAQPVQHYLGALGHQRARHRQPDPGGRAGHERSLACEILALEHWRQLLQLYAAGLCFCRARGGCPAN